MNVLRDERIDSQKIYLKSSLINGEGSYTGDLNASKIIFTPYLFLYSLEGKNSSIKLYFFRMNIFSNKPWVWSKDWASTKNLTLIFPQKKHEQNI